MLLESFQPKPFSRPVEIRIESVYKSLIHSNLPVINEGGQRINSKWRPFDTSQEYCYEFFFKRTLCNQTLANSVLIWFTREMFSAGTIPAELAVCQNIVCRHPEDTGEASEKNRLNFFVNCVYMLLLVSFCSQFSILFTIQISPVLVLLLTRHQQKCDKIFVSDGYFLTYLLL